MSRGNAPRALPRGGEAFALAEAIPRDGDAAFWIGETLRGRRPRLAAPAPAARAAAVAALAAEAAGRGRPVVVVVAHARDAEARARDIEALGAGGPPVLLCPAFEGLPFEGVGPVASRAPERLAALAALALAPALGPPVVVVPARAFARRTLARAVLERRIVRLRPGAVVDPHELRGRLLSMGYRRAPEVEEVGDIAPRGGVLDVWPPGLGGPPRPVRLEWDGDAISSIRAFDAETQESVGEVDEAIVGPPREALPGLVRDGDDLRRRLGRALRPGLVRDRVLEDLAAGEWPDAMEALLPFVGGSGSFLEHLGGAAVVVEDPDAVEAEWERLAEEAAVESVEADLGYERPPLHLAPAEARDALAATAPAVLLSLPADDAPTMEVESLPRAPDGRVDAAALSARGLAVVAFAGAAGNVERAREVLPGADARAGHLAEGVVLPRADLALVGETDLWGGRPHRPARGGRRRVRPEAWRDLSPGDLVVHPDHGIGVYRGVRRVRTGGAERDLLAIEYADGDVLYVPPDTAGVERYVAGDGAPPAIHRLGGTAWARTAERVRRAAQAFARDLLDLYALRRTLAGVAYPRTSADQRAFEAAFPFDETPDQAAAAREVAADQAAPVPMDRLLCGDVGYGKTEVAMRAAFRVVEAGKQVAVLVPTTILARQHLQTFRERFAGWPVRIEMLSRYVPEARQRLILAGLERPPADAEAVRILIGTHRLLSPDVRFRDLGLVVVDEEHRFGVAAKERLKALRKEVDVLSLSATPIPRTLHLALAGLRDVSVIHTPPEGRSPIQTIVVPWKPETVRRAIRRELDREGQVFFVHNRIETLDRAVEILRRLVPEARIVVAHGRMESRRIAEAMEAFVSGAADVLASTSIVEAGLDIPRANTLVVDRADRFGLASLYQLRGRVGRSNVKAYAYFLYPPDRPLHPAARGRLEALAVHSALGSGFAVALRDLEIRGAGNVLGPEQAGEVRSVGIDLYSRLLARAVAEMRGETLDASAPARIDLAVEAYLPVEWIGDARLAPDLYRELADARSVADVEGRRRAWRDRFGPIPPPAENVLALATLRAYADLDGVASIRDVGDAVEIAWRRPVDRAEVEEVLAAMPFLAARWRDEPGATLLEVRGADRAGKVEVVRRIVRR